MTELQTLQLLSELGLKPTEVILLGVFWQNIKSTRTLLVSLTKKVNRLENQLECKKKAF